MIWREESRLRGTARSLVYGCIVALSGCQHSETQANRFREIHLPRAVQCDGLPTITTVGGPGCGLAIMDTQTGTIFIHEGSDWLEQDPHTGKSTWRNIEISK
jgi:hypothetical protein